MVEIIRVKCPKCGSILKIGKRDRMENVNLTCHLCVYKGLFPSFKPLDNIYTNNNRKCEDKTKMGNPTELINKTSIGRLRYNGQVINLKEGVNIVGRKAESSKATIQIDDETRKISREHIIITVVRVGKNIVEHRVQLHKKEVNTTLLNNKKLQYGDVMILTDGSVITLPTAKLVFEMDKNTNNTHGNTTT